MTTNLTQTFIDLVNYLVSANSPRSTSQRQSIRKQASRFVVALLGFIIGGATGAILTVKVGLLCAIAPAILLVVLAGLLPRFTTENP